MKIVKCVLKALLWIFGIVVALVLALPLWIGPVVKTAANAVVPSKTGTGFNLGEFGLNQYNGRLTVGDMQLANPEGCSQKMAATLGKLHVDVDMGTVLSDTIVIEDVVLSDVFVSYVSNDKGENNFAIIKRNATGEDESKVKGEGEKVKVKGERRSEKLSSSQTPQTSQTSKKVIIDHLLVKNVLVQLGPVSLPLPNIELKGIGRKSNGATLAEAWDQIYDAIMKSLSSVGVNLNDLVNNLSSAGMEQALKAINAAKAVNVKGVTDALKGGADLATGAAGKTVDTVGKSASKAAGAVGESATKATDAATKGVGKAVDAVNEQTDKAVNAIKGLFN